MLQEPVGEPFFGHASIRTGSDTPKQGATGDVAVVVEDPAAHVLLDAADAVRAVGRRGQDHWPVESEVSERAHGGERSGLGQAGRKRQRRDLDAVIEAERDDDDFAASSAAAREGRQHDQQAAHPCLNLQAKAIPLLA